MTDNEGRELTVTTGGELFAYLWPAAFIIAGLYLLVRAVLTRRAL